MFFPALASGQRYTGCLRAVQLGFNIIYDIGDIYVMFIPTYVIWVLWVGVGVAAICRQAGRLSIRWRRSPSRLGSVTLLNRFSLTTEQAAAWLVFLIALLLPATLLIQESAGAQSTLGLVCLDTMATRLDPGAARRRRIDQQ